MTDLNVLNSKPIITKDIDLVIQQIDMLFDTDEEEVLGEVTYGTNFDRFLYDLNISNSYISDYVYNKIVSNVNLLGFVVKVNTQISEGTLNDIIFISIGLSRDMENYEKTYKIG